MPLIADSGGWNTVVRTPGLQSAWKGNIYPSISAPTAAPDADSAAAAVPLLPSIRIACHFPSAARRREYTSFSPTFVSHVLQECGPAEGHTWA